MDELVSVIIPVYNVQNYLVKCLDTLAKQNYSNIEVILVNDGSTDKSREICLKYTKIYQNFILIDRENGGLSAARNTGISNSNGEYLTFVDSDDFVSEDYVSYLMMMIKKFGCDLAACSHQTVNPKSVEKDTTIGEEELISDKEYFHRLGSNQLPKGLDISIWSKIFHKSLFESIKFPQGELFEDSSTFYRLVMKSQEIAIGSKIKYFYLRRPNSIVTASFNMSRMDFIKAERRMKEAVLNKYPELSNEMKQRFNYAKMNTLAHAVRSGDKKYLDVQRKLRKEILENYTLIVKSKTVPIRDRIGMHALRVGLMPYKVLFNIYKFIQSKE